MGLKTLSSFYYGHEVDKVQHFISIDEGAGELTINLTPSGYSFTELGVELQRALNESGLLNYTVLANRLTRKYTISADGVFDILAGTGAYFGSLLFQTLGFNTTDKTGLTTYTSDNATGFEWRPQLQLFNYVPSNLREGSVQATQDESGAGKIEIVNFGTVNYMECESKYITSRHDKPDIIELDINGVTNAISFLKYARKKNRIEFMPDRNAPDTYETFILQKTADSSNGLEVKLYEMTGQNLQDYYETRLLTFRKV